MHPLYDTKTWVFDLDNTLYAPHSNLFDQIDKRMGAYISDLLGVDLIEARAGARTALVAYSGTAHRVSPLTEDPNILRPLLQGLTPKVMPVGLQAYPTIFIVKGFFFLNQSVYFRFKRIRVLHFCYFY